jgi:hypothetical protein
MNYIKRRDFIDMLHKISQRLLDSSKVVVMTNVGVTREDTADEIFYRYAPDFSDLNAFIKEESAELGFTVSDVKRIHVGYFHDVYFEVSTATWN